MARRSESGSRVAVRIEGLDQFVRDLRAMDRDYGTTGRTEIQRELQAAAEIVANHARTVTAPMAGMVGTQARRVDRDGRAYGRPRKGYKPGRTTRGSSIRAYVRGAQGYVSVRAASRGFRYPFMYEFGTSQRNTNPHRPFLYPAIDEKRDEVMETLAASIDRVARRHGYKGGITVG